MNSWSACGPLFVMRRQYWFAAIFFSACSDLPPDPPPAPTILSFSVVDGVSGAPVPEGRIMVGDRPWQTVSSEGGVELTFSGADTVGYRVEAPGYQAVPRPFRPTPMAEVSGEATTELEVSLQPVDHQLGLGGLAGMVSSPDGPVAGALVVATGAQIRLTVTDSEGRYEIGGLPSDLYQVTAFFAGLSVDSSGGIRVEDQKEEDVDLIAAPVVGVEVGGVILGGTGQTTVYLLHPATGHPIPGLSVKTNLSSTWAVPGTPPGNYQVEVALEFDNAWVSDVEQIRTRGLPEISVATASVTLDLTVSPAIRGLSPVDTTTVSGSPNLSWRSVPEADFYVVEVRDESDRVRFGGFDAQGDPRIRVLPPSTEQQYEGEPLVVGARYRWRVFAGKVDPQNPSRFALIAGSERFGGEFLFVE